MLHAPTHAGGAAALRELEQALMRYEEGGDKEFPAFASAVERFTIAYWDHMQKEEEKAFHLAQKILTGADCKMIDQAFEENRAPLASQREAKDFQEIFSRIVNLAPPPIGVGPAA
jgi:hemerythrin-like domain-containing protein